MFVLLANPRIFWKRFYELIECARINFNVIELAPDVIFKDLIRIAATAHEHTDEGTDKCCLKDASTLHGDHLVKEMCRRPQGQRGDRPGRMAGGYGGKGPAAQ